MIVVITSHSVTGTVVQGEPLLELSIGKYADTRILMHACKCTQHTLAHTYMHVQHILQQYVV